MKRKSAPPLVARFIAMLLPTRKSGTCVLYEQYLRQFHDWLIRSGVNLDELSRKHTVQWLIYLSRRYPNAGTRRKTILNVRSYLRWLHAEGLLQTHADELILTNDLPKLPSYLPRPIDAQADRDLQARLRKSEDRLHQGLLLMRRTGLRIGELRSLELDCIRTDPQGRKFLKVPLGKLDSERLVPLDDDTIEIIEKLQKRGRQNQPWLLGTERGEKIKCDPLRRALRNACQGIAITGKMVPHRLRHTFATSMLSGGMSLLGVMKLLGHRDYHMTLRYTEITQETVGKEYFEALTRLETKYRRNLHNMHAEQFDPVKVIADVIRWIHKNIAPDKAHKRLARLIIRRLERIRKEISIFVNADDR